MGPEESEHMPIRIEFVESVETVATLMPELCEMLSDGLIEAHETTVFKARSGSEEPV
jgi:PII-like signaling protein